MQNNLSKILTLVFIIVLYHIYNPVFTSILADWSGQDFQWQPSKCVFEGINHYSSYLKEDNLCPKFKSQNGDYAQGLYIILYPFTLFEWETAKILWSFLNIILVITITFLLCKKFELGKINTILSIFFVLYSKVTPNNIALGQQGIFILFFLVLPFIFNSKFIYILSGISYFKYNIGYALFLFYFVKKEFKNLLYSLIPIIAGIFLYCFFTDTNILVNIFQPIKLMLKSTTVFNNTFLFSFVNEFLPFNRTIQLVITLLLTLSLNIFLIFKISKIDDDLLKLSCLSITILISMPHHGHDYILMIPLLIFSIKNFQFGTLLNYLNLLTSIYFLHFYNVIPLIFNDLQLLQSFSKYFQVLGLFLLLMLNLLKNDFDIKKRGKN